MGHLQVEGTDTEFHGFALHSELFPRCILRRIPRGCGCPEATLARATRERCCELVRRNVRYSPPGFRYRGFQLQFFARRVFERRHALEAKRGTTFRCPETPSPFDRLSVAEKSARGAVVGQHGSPNDTCGAFLDWSAACSSHIGRHPTGADRVNEDAARAQFGGHDLGERVERGF